MNKRYRQIAEIYKAHSTLPRWDFSEDALLALYEFETHGVRTDLTSNGYAIGKKFLDVTLAAWREDVAAGLITKDEILSSYEEDSFEYTFYEKVMEDWTAGVFFPYTDR